MREGRLLLVEGQDDKHVLWALLQAHGLPEQFTVREVKDAGPPRRGGGVDRLLALLPLELKSQGLDRLGLMLDANESLMARWRRVLDLVAAVSDDPMPERPHPAGTVVSLMMRDTGVRKHLGVWFMPDNERAGMLEDFVATLVPAGDALLPAVDRFLDQLPERRFATQHRSKARLHGWLAVQKEPGRPQGQAITAGYLDARAASALMAWMRRLFIDAPLQDPPR